jgi:hypothetical protein
MFKFGWQSVVKFDHAFQVGQADLLPFHIKFNAHCQAESPIILPQWIFAAYRRADLLRLLLVRDLSYTSQGGLESNTREIYAGSIMKSLAVFEELPKLRLR